MSDTETETEAEVQDEYTPLFNIKQGQRSKLFTPKNLLLIAQLKTSDLAQYVKLIDTLAENGVKKLRDLEAEVDKTVKKAERRQAAQAEARDIPDDGFERDAKSGAILATQANIRLAIEKLGVSLRYDAFAGNPVVEGMEGFGPTLDDRAMNRLWLQIDEDYRFRPQMDFFHVVVSDACLRNPFHPVCDYLDALSWDGKPRLDTWLLDHCGVKDTPYSRAVGAIMLIAAVRRVRHPGSKHDEMLVLESPEGFNKSTLLQLLAVNDDWFSDSLPLNVDDKRMIENASGKWVVEISELQGMRKGDVGHIKAQLSRQRDRARLAYARLPIEVDRQCMFFGTVNPAEATGYLASLTGNRRFWPVEVGRIDIEAFRRDRDQLWAEASTREAQGESTRLDPDLWADAAEQQSQREAPNPFYDALLPILGQREGIIFADDLWLILEIPVERRASHYEKLGKAMKDLGWRRVKRRRRRGGKQTGAYERGDERRRVTVERDYALRHGELVIGFEDATEDQTEADW